jgi:hypothetical protein
MLQPTIRKTWAPRGQTPIPKCYDRRDRLTVVSALSVSPQRRRLGLLFDILDHNLTAEDFDLFVTRLLRKIRGPVTLVIDRLGAHRAAVRSLQARYGLDSKSSGCRRMPLSSTLRNTCGDIPRPVILPSSFPTMCFILDERSPHDSARQGTTNLFCDRSSRLRNCPWNP